MNDIRLTLDRDVEEGGSHATLIPPILVPFVYPVS